jgi:hypothetical protein
MLALTLGAVPALAAKPSDPCVTDITVSASPQSLSLSGWNPLSGVNRTTNTTVTVTKTNGSKVAKVELIVLDSQSNPAPLKIGSAGPAYVFTNSGGNQVGYPSSTSVTGLTSSGKSTFTFTSNQAQSLTDTLTLALNQTQSDSAIVAATSYSEIPPVR